MNQIHGRIPFVNNLVEGKVSKAWNCECHIIIHSEQEAKEHQKIHTLQRIAELDRLI